MEQTIGKKINDTIKQGHSPVKGGKRRYEKYSSSYQDSIKDGSVLGTDGRNYRDKRKRPVNLTVSGDMLNSQNVKSTAKGVTISYSKKVNGVNIASVHNKGDASRNLPARRILPDGKGEQFSREIQKHIEKVSKGLVKNTVRKLNKG